MGKIIMKKGAIVEVMNENSEMYGKRGEIIRAEGVKLKVQFSLFSKPKKFNARELKLIGEAD